MGLEEALKLHKYLLTDLQLIDWLKDNKKIEIENIADYQIGWDQGEKAFSFPQRDHKELYIGVVHFKMDDKSDWLENAESGFKDVDLVTSLRSENYSRKISFNGIVIGKDLSPFLIPKKVDIECEQAGKYKKCAECMLAKGKVERVFSPKADRDLLVGFINANDQQINGAIRKNYNIPAYNTCRRVNLKIVERSSVEDIRLTAEVNYERIDSEYVVHKCFVFDDSIKSNQQYKCWGTTWQDPNSQQGIHLINRIKGERDNISKWELTPNKREELEIFAAKDIHDKDCIGEKIRDIHKDLSLNITKMKRREDVIMAIDLVYHSPLNFNFLGNYIQKGWAECAIIGDTRTGKTETMRNLVKHYRAGEFLTSGENTSLAGLLGGVQQTHNGRWSLTWGKLPMNDRRALVIDEADNLSEANIIGHLSGVRSSGVAELIKIQTQRTMARTRLIFAANPLNGRVSEYSFGVNIVKEMFGKQQDIARLDFAIICTKDDVSDAEINVRQSLSVDHVYTSDLCHDRIMFAWNIRPENIVWAEGVEDLILNIANEMGQKYSPEIPLIIGAEFRIKLARLALSVAIMTFSVNLRAEKVVVGRGHVEYVTQWLQKQYDSPSFGYLDYSEQKRLDKTLKEPEILDVVIDDVDKVNMFLSTGRIQLADAEDIFTLDRIDARKKISILRKCGAIKKVSFYYVKTPPFIEYLKAKRAEFRNGGIL